MQLEGFVSDRAEFRFAARVEQVARRSRAQFGDAVTAARARAEDAADTYREVLAVVVDKRRRGKLVTRSLQARLDEAFAAMDRANDAVEAALAAKLAA